MRSFVSPQRLQARVGLGMDRPKKKRKDKYEHHLRDAKPRRGKRVGAKRDMEDALVIKTDDSEFSVI